MGVATVVLIKKQTAAASKRFRVSKVPATILLTGTFADAEGAQLLRYVEEGQTYEPINDCDGNARGLTGAAPIGRIVAPGDYKISKGATVAAAGVQLQILDGLSTVNLFT